ncbi:MAG: glycoside hydrolase family 2 TIM barrel-domain containing protein, partial [Verrucomicrobiota bacterium]
FKGVDYQTHVFLNGSFLGSHEGFFAPFEFEFTKHAKVGENVLLVRVENDFICNSNNPWGDPRSGDKIYAATNQGYDDPEKGWHHCPPGMGMYQDARIEFRARSFISDIYVRPLPEENRAEIWFEAFNCDADPLELDFSISVFGRNFEAAVVEDMNYHPSVIHECGVGDALQIALAKAAGTYRKPTPLKVGPGPNLFKVPVEMSDFKWWSPDEPWLYQAQITMRDADGATLDARENHFGMRSFRMDEEGEMKGGLFLNGEPIRLRGGNTMGHEQQCVAKRDWDQLRDDILLAKICNMNFLRLTQRPVEPEIYDYCDMLGLMNQCDLPTFAVLRRTQYCEALRQVEEMERLARPHPSVIMISYINEPVNNSGNQPHRNLSRDEFNDLFDSADRIVRRLNPERVIKACDGDYDPPSPGIQDRHCYTTWYNGQGVDYGKLHKGWWQPTKADWYYGCGEFGAEGLEDYDFMRRHYPKDWLPGPDDNEGDWEPGWIQDAQTGRFHFFFFETPTTVDEWVEQSQKYQADSMRYMAEAFRRDNRMVTFAIHLFIDAFPSGWMKTIMDCERQPKQAYFAYRDALAPLLPNLRTDRSRLYAGEPIKLEAWVCNDPNTVPEGAELRYEIKADGEILSSGSSAAVIEACAATFQGYLTAEPIHPDSRTIVTARLAIVSASGETLNDTSINLEVFPRIESAPPAVRTIGEAATAMAGELDAANSTDAPVIVVDDLSAFESEREAILDRVKAGARLVLLELEPGTHHFGEHEIKVKTSGFNPIHFASRRTGHPLVEGFEPHDFRHWFDPAEDCIAPIIHHTFLAEGARPILLTGNSTDDGQWKSALAAAEFDHGDGRIVICQVNLPGRTGTNPPAKLFANRLLSGSAS